MAFLFNKLRLSLIRFNAYGLILSLWQDSRDDSDKKNEQNF